jgi:hypothetical protein
VSEPGFVVGGRYANTAGEYEVLALDGGAVRIRYANGFEMSLPAQGLWAAWETVVEQRTGRPAAPAAKKEAVPRASATPRATAARAEAAPRRAAADRITKAKKAATGDAGFHTAAGYLALGCEITASVAGRDYPAFAQRYKIHTGRTLVTPHDGLEIHERPTHKIGAELTVRFPASADALSHFNLGTGAKPVPEGESGEYIVTRAELVERLFKLGFDLGKNIDPAPIRERVPEAQIGNFDRGVGLRRALRRT